MNLPQITAEQLDEFLAQKKSCVVVFSKESCSVCKVLAPMMENVAKEYEGNDALDFYSIDVKSEN